MTTVLVSGAIANKPLNGGNAWAVLSYVLGFRKLGFDVYLVEQNSPAADSAYLHEVCRQVGLQDRVALVSPELRSVAGIPYDRLLDIADSASLLVNISGHLAIEDITSRAGCRAYIDLDPGFTQFWHAKRSGGFMVGAHDHYFTVGENIGAADCLIPSNGIPWRRTRQPVVLDYWPVGDEPSADSRRFTTIATWRGPFGPVDYENRALGSKVHEFRKYAGIPGQTDATFEIALNIHPADDKDRELLSRNCWNLVDPIQVAPDPLSFRRYIQSSDAEFSVAQQMYVDTKSGWFSDRTVRYLASGKPVLVQETGFSRNYPTGSGLLAFSTVQEAIDGAANIQENYSEHAVAARRIAEEYFDSDRVLSEMLQEMGF